MSGQIDAGGGAVTAGLIGATIEGGGKRKPGNGEACSNCATPVQGYYCSNCGQPAHIHRSILHMLEEALHGVVHFDTKFWRTLPRLIVRPGTLTHEYVHGKRARYVSPMAFFLFSVFLMFFAFSFLGGPGTVNLGARRDRAAALAEMRQEIAQGASEAGNAAGQTWQQQWIAMLDRGDVRVALGDAAFNKKILKKLRNPDLILYKLQQTAYKFSFLLIPLSVPFVGLLFLCRRGVTWFDHTVFVLYSVSVMSIAVVAAAGLDMLPLLSALAPFVLLLGAPLHMFFQVKGAYALGWFSALWRTAALLVFAGLALVLFLLAVLVLGLAG